MLRRAAVFCAPQSVHTLAQSRQETLSSNSIPFWSGDNPVEASGGSDGQVRVVQQTEEGHSRSCTAVGVAETTLNIGGVDGLLTTIGIGLIPEVL